MTPSKPATKVKFEVAHEDLDILLDDLRALAAGRQGGSRFRTWPSWNRSAGNARSPTAVLTH